MAKKTLVYLIGEPAVGKTTTVKALVQPYNKVEQYENKVPHILYADKDGKFALSQLGKDRDNFSGTDALPMNIIEFTENFLKENPYPRILAEGARLANKRFLQLALDNGYKVVLAVLWGETEALERRQARGSGQNESWVAGRRTATQNLAKSAPNGVLVEWIKASLSVNERVEILKNLLEL